MLREVLLVDVRPCVVRVDGGVRDDGAAPRPPDGARPEHLGRERRERLVPVACWRAGEAVEVTTAESSSPFPNPETVER